MDARLRATQRGKQHWSSALPHLEAWLASRPASIAASEPGYEVSSMMGSGDEVISTTGPLAEDFVVQGINGVSSIMADALGNLPNTVAATSLLGAATQLTPSTIQSIVLQLSIQDTPSASGPPLISIPSAAPTAPSAVSLISMSLAAPTATPLLPIMSVRPNPMGYFAGAPSNFILRVISFLKWQTLVGRLLKGSNFYKISSFKNDSSLRLEGSSSPASGSAGTGSFSGAFGAYCHC